MRILCVITNLDAGGAQRQMVNLACGLKQRGHDVEFFVYYPHSFFRPQLDEARIPVHMCQKTSRFSIVPAWHLRRLIKAGRFKIVLAFLETATVYAELSCIGLGDVRLVVSERNFVTNANESLERCAKALLHLLAHNVVTNSYAQHEWITARFPFLKGRLATIWNGIDTELFRPADIVPESHHLRLLGVGRISPQKNLLGLAKALAECKERGLSVTLDWAGQPDNSTYQKTVLAMIESHQLADSWRWLGVRNDIPGLLSAYDALILPSLWEGLPNVVGEALAAGLPVLAGDIADNARLVQHGVSGFVFDPTQPSDMARTIQQFAELDQESRTRFSHAAREFARDRLSLSVYIDAYERLLFHRGGDLVSYVTNAGPHKALDAEEHTLCRCRPQ